MKKSVLLALLAAGPAFAADPVRFEWFQYDGLDAGHEPRPAAGTYRNPILPGYYPDPSITRVGDKFYLVNSTFAHWPGIPIHESTDLVNWKLIGYALNDPAKISYDGLDISRGVFAPAIEHHAGTYYIINTLADAGGNFFVTSKNPGGPYSDPVWLKEIDGIDPAFFFDDDGKAYILNNGPPVGTPRYSGHRAIWIQEFDVETQKVVGPRKVIVDGGAKPADNPIWIEGPHLYKIDGTYYLMCAEGGTGYMHSEVIFRSKSPWGPWEPYAGNPILTQRDLGMNRPNGVTSTGHADLVQRKDGSWWAVFLGTRPYSNDRYNTGRETFLLPVTWKDGWPIILPKGQELPRSVHLKDGRPNNQRWDGVGPAIVMRDDFDGKAATEWLQVYVPRKTWHRIDAGALWIDALDVRLDEKRNSSFLARRQQDLKFDASTELSPVKPGVAAGLAAYQNSEHWYFLGTRTNGAQQQVFLERRAGKETKLLAETSVTTDKPLRLRIRGRDQNYSFDYDAGAGWKALVENDDGSILSTEVAGGFVGTVLGPHARTESPAPPAAPPVAADPSKEDWRVLFNGKDLSGWTPKISKHALGENYADTFRVEDGLLKVRYDKYKNGFDGQFGHLFYKEPFSYYRLVVEYRFVGDQAPRNPGTWAFRNSGAMLHSPDPRTMPRDQTFPISIEAQFLGGRGDGTARPTVNMCSPGTEIVYQGSIYKEHCLNSTSPTFDGDQWVRAEMIVHGSGTIEHRANGQTVLEYELPQYGGAQVDNYDTTTKPDGTLIEGGWISLQSESHPVDFRKVELLNLAGCMDRKATNYKSYYVKSVPEDCKFAEGVKPAMRRPGEYAFMPDSLPQPGVPKGRLEGPFEFHSQIFAGTVRRYWIYVPAQYDAKRPKPANLLVFQDGQRATNPEGSLRVPQVMENLIAQGRMPVTIGVFVTPGNTSEKYPDDLAMRNPNHRAQEYDALNDRYARMLIEELLPEIGKKYRLTDDPEKRVIGGTSSGAICAFTAAWQRPDYFRRVISMIGSYTSIGYRPATETEPMSPGGDLYPTLIRKNPIKPIRIFLQDGSQDLSNEHGNWFLANQQMLSAFEYANAKADRAGTLGTRYEVKHQWGDGAHSDQHGGVLLPGILEWIWTND